MFNDIIGKITEPENVVWDSPKFMTFQFKDETKQMEIYKGADTFIHYKLDIKPNTSKEVYKKSEQIWKSLRDCQLSKFSNTDDRDYFAFDKPTLVYLCDERNNLIDVFDAKTVEYKNNFKSKLDKFILDITTTEKTKKFFAEGKGDILKLVFYDKDADLPEQDFTPVVLLEASTKKSQYKVYTGILIFKSFTFIPSPFACLDYDCYSDLVIGFDIDDLMNKSNESGKDLYGDYKSAQTKPIEVSARELVHILKQVGYKLELLDDNQLHPIDAINDTENSKKIQDFFNTFRFTTGESAYDILALSELKKIFRYNKLTMIDVLSILSKEYLNYDGGKITAETLSNIVTNLFGKKTDKGQAESIENEIKDI